MRYLKWIIILIIILVLGFTFIKVSKQEVKKISKEPVSLVFDDEKVGYISIHDIHINEEDSYYIFTANITNLTADKISYNNIVVYVKDDDKLIMTLTGYFGGYLEEEETKNIVIKTNKDLSNAKKLKFEFKD